ncbi:NAD(P)-binding protein [Aspergillus steynii IBT 23096]|uniref:NAD(P)-binding protein n=1 Tax=Aspergillus steynii IBT 23096 TaxID=1392250 RepID=A0A2I2GS22_9EURO|nr:NAD(P)-binding protein [Aspergillus steynii IBT 23096]PLB55674.1 NAD(P)-binding protein [Aspergillus steynii IBT 23096]
MHLTILPASTQTAQATIRAILNDKTQPATTVEAIYRNPSKVPDEFALNPRFRAVKGDIDDPSTLDLSDTDAVFVITPPTFDGADTFECARSTAENVKAAARKGGVKRVVYLSSIGAQCESGTGEILANHISETVLKDAAPEVVFIRCGYFMENWATALPTVKSENPFFYSTVTPLEYELPMIAVKDIGQSAASQLLGTGTPLPKSPYIYELHGPRPYTSRDVQKAYEKAAGKEVEAKPVEKEDLGPFFAQVMPGPLVQPFVEMTLSFLPGGVALENVSGEVPNVQRSKTELDEVIGELYRR